MGVGGAAAAADDIDQGFLEEGADVGGHQRGCLVVLAQLVGEAGVGVGTNIYRYARARGDGGGGCRWEGIGEFGG